MERMEARRTEDRRTVAIEQLEQCERPELGGVSTKRTTALSTVWFKTDGRRLDERRRRRTTAHCDRTATVEEQELLLRRLLRDCPEQPWSGRMESDMVNFRLTVVKVSFNHCSFRMN